MNAKNIKKVLGTKVQDWIDSIDDDRIALLVRKNVMITGGAIVSLLLNEPVNDYDVYFKNVEACREVARYYMDEWNSMHPELAQVSFYEPVLGGESDVVDTNRVQLVIGRGRGQGMVAEDDDTGIDDVTEPYTSENEENPTEPDPKISKPRYRPRFFSTNAISLSDKIQLVIRFTGSIEDIHKNFDFEHTKCCYDFDDNVLTLPARSLECIINKELVYSGSKYPLTSIIRTRKFIMRGWTINAGQYVKMALELNEKNLKDLATFKDQVVGVDSAYFMLALNIIADKMEKDPSFKLDNTYLFEVINRIF